MAQKNETVHVGNICLNGFECLNYSCDMNRHVEILNDFVLEDFKTICNDGEDLNKMQNRLFMRPKMDCLCGMNK